LAAELMARMERDQEARRRLEQRPAEPAGWELVQAVDAENTAWLEAVVDRQGWPTRARVGDEATQAAWLLAQHADHDLGFQRQCRTLLAEAVRRGEADPKHLAYLTDRVLCAEGQPQRYGTQFWHGRDGTGQLQPQPIEDPEHLDERRLAAGLTPFAEYAQIMRRHHSADG